MHSNLRGRPEIFFTFIAALGILFFSGPFVTDVSAAKPKLPPYRSSGPVSGTSLAYEKLVINEKGEVSVTIVNPTNNGVSFMSNFSFYNAKDEFLTGFTLDGFAAANKKIEYSFVLDDYAAYRKAVTMKVLGRSGRMGKTPEPGDAGE